EGGVEGRAASGVARLVEGDDLAVPLAGRLRGAPADDHAVGHDEGADPRVGRRAAARMLGEPRGLRHQLLVPLTPCGHSCLLSALRERTRRAGAAATRSPLPSGLPPWALDSPQVNRTAGGRGPAGSAEVVDNFGVTAGRDLHPSPRAGSVWADRTTSRAKLKHVLVPGALNLRHFPGPPRRKVTQVRGREAGGGGARQAGRGAGGRRSRRR